MAETPLRDRSDLEVDPVYRHSIREAVFILVVWFGCFVWTCTYCYLYGYASHEPNPTATPVAIGELVGPLESFNRDPLVLEEPFGLGIPDWVFYGVVVPWLFCIVLTFWYCFYFFTEDDLEAE